jgi:carboxylesterase
LHLTPVPAAARSIAHFGNRRDNGRSFDQFADKLLAFSMQQDARSHMLVGCMDFQKIRFRFHLSGGKMAKKPYGVLMLHGFPSNSGYFLPLESPLRALGLPIRNPLLRGLGAESPEALRGVTWHDWLADAESALMDLLAESEKAIVIGYSMGGALTLMLAANHAEEVDSLILAAPGVQMSSPFAPGRPFNFLIPLLAAFLTKWDFPPDSEDFYRKNYTWAPKGAVLSVLDLSRKVRSHLPEIKMPVLLLQGRKDSAVRPENVEIIYQGISSPAGLKRVIWFEKSGHDVLHDC